jgi:hypothetical protein
MATARMDTSDFVTQVTGRIGGNQPFIGQKGLNIIFSVHIVWGPRNRREAMVKVAKREMEAAQRRAEKAWHSLETQRARKLQEVTEIEKELEAMHPVMLSLFATA